VTHEIETPTVLDTPAAGGAAIRGAGVRTFAYGAGVILSVASAALLFRHLGVADAGRYVTVLSLITIVAGLTDAGLTTIGQREIAAASGATGSSFLANLLGLRLVLTLLGVAGAVVFSVAAGYSTAMVAGTAIVGGALVIQMVQATVAIPLMTQLRLGWVALAEFVRQAGMVVLIVAFVLAGFGLVPFYAAAVPAAIASLAVTVWRVRSEVPLRFDFDRSAWWSVLRETLPFAAATAVTAIYFRFAIVLMSLIASSRQTGYFSASFRVIDVLVAVLPLVVGAGFPILARAARSDRQRVAYGLGRMWEAATALGAGLFVALFAGAHFVIHVIAGPKFGPAASVLRIQSIGLMASFAGAAWAYGLLAMRMHREVLVVTLVALASTALLTPLLVPPLGADGAAIATVVTEMLLAIALPSTLIRAHRDMRPSSRYTPRIIACALGAAAIGFVPGVPSVALLFGASAAYVVALLVTRALPEELFEQVRLLRRR
jgi:O-antigen/teichoic acid export membrane protein